MKNLFNINSDAGKLLAIIFGTAGLITIGKMVCLTILGIAAAKSGEKVDVTL